MATWWAVQLAAGAVMVGLFRYQRWSVRRPLRGSPVRLDEGFGLQSAHLPNVQWRQTLRTHPRLHR